jgi:hypothetical protein
VKRPIIELLEQRRLLSGTFSAQINFQPGNATVPTGYEADTGGLFGNQGNGFTYGWNGPKPAQVVGRRVHSQPAGTDAARYDTFAVMHAKGRGSIWEIQVPNGTYTVSITAGDPSAGGVQRIQANGTFVVNGKPTIAKHWATGSQQIMVTDGLLKLTVPKGATSKIDFVNITQAVGGGIPGALIIPQVDRQVLTLTKNAAGGIETILNGVTTDYAPGQWTAVVYSGNANIASVFVEATVVPTTITTNSVTNVFVGNVAGGTNGTQQITSPLEIDLPAGGQTTFDDRGDTTARSVSLGNSSQSGKFDLTGITPAAITFQSPAATIYTGGAADSVNVAATPSTSLNLINSGGADALTFGNGSLANFKGPAIVQASAGVNNITIDDTADSSGNAFAMAAPTVTTPAGVGPLVAINFGLAFNASRQATSSDEIAFDRRTTSAVTIKSDTAASFGNTFTASFDPTAPGALAVNYQGGGNDTANISADEASTTFNVTAKMLTAGPLSLGVDGPVHFTGVGSNASLQLQTNQLQTLAMSAGKFSQGTGVIAYASTSFVGLSTTNFYGSEPITLDYSSGDALPPALQFNGSFFIQGFPVTGDPLAGHRIDIGPSRLLFAYAPGKGKQLQDLIRKYLHSAYTGSTWLQSGSDMITSSYAAGYTDNAMGVSYTDSADGTIIGQQFDTIQVINTFFGDINGDGFVNAADKAILEAHLNQPGDWNWGEGDFNYDGSVTNADLAVLNSHLT